MEGEKAHTQQTQPDKPPQEPATEGENTSSDGTTKPGPVPVAPQPVAPQPVAPQPVAVAPVPVAVGASSSSGGMPVPVSASGTAASNLPGVASVLAASSNVGIGGFRAAGADHHGSVQRASSSSSSADKTEGYFLKHLRDGYVAQGVEVLSFRYHGKEHWADILEDGWILVKDPDSDAKEKLRTPHEWVMNVIRAINPARKAESAQETVKYKGTKLKFVLPSTRKRTKVVVGGQPEAKEKKQKVNPPASSTDAGGNGASSGDGAKKSDLELPKDGPWSLAADDDDDGNDEGEGETENPEASGGDGEKKGGASGDDGDEDKDEESEDENDGLVIDE